MFNSTVLGWKNDWHAHVLGALVALGCSSGSGNSNPSASTGKGGQVTDQWRGFCVATFTQDVAFQNGFGDVTFTAHTGEQYLLTAFDQFAGAPRAEIAYLTPLGPDTYTVPVTSGSTTLPFTSNCTLGSTTQYYAAFTDVTVYDTQSLSNKICSIPAGTALPLDTTTMAGSSSVGISLNGPQVYDIMLNAFSSMCGGASDGFVSVPQTQVFGVYTWLVPITTVLKPQ